MALGRKNFFFFVLECMDYNLQLYLLPCIKPALPDIPS